MSEAIFCIDMQGYYKPYLPVYSEACRAIDAFSAAGERNGVPTWAIYLDFINDFRNLILTKDTPRRKRKKCLTLFDRSATGILGEFKQAKDMTVVFKRFTNAFDNVNLADELKYQGITKIYMTGYCDSDCVASTALGASLNGFETVIVQDLAYGHQRENDTAALRKKQVSDFLTDQIIYGTFGITVKSDAERSVMMQDIIQEQGPRYLAMQKIRIMRKDEIFGHQPERAETPAIQAPELSLTIA